MDLHRIQLRYTVNVSLSIYIAIKLATFRLKKKDISISLSTVVNAYWQFLQCHTPK